MIPVSLSPLFNDVFNHLWQSTLFAAVAALLALTLTKNHARARHGLWLSASAKFLIPFSLLVTMGSHIAWPTATSIAQPRVSVLMQEVSQPFTVPVIPSAVPAPAPASPLPALLLVVWACGLIAVALSWYLHWRRIRAILRTASPVALQTEVKVMSSPALLEPGVFGIFRPVLLLPEGITDRLAPVQLKAILAHELCHIRRRDNLAAAIHMLVEALFWFHPLVWWLGARLVDERERACDEAVLQSGSEPQVYAEGILKVCEFYVESPLFCISGVTGADLKNRIVRIMTHRIGTHLSFGKKALLAGAAMGAIAGPIAIGLVNAPQTHAQSQPASTFEVASIKPSDSSSRGVHLRNVPGGRFTASGVTAKRLIAYGYNVSDFQVSGGPSWINAYRYDIVAKAEDSSDERNLNEDQRNALREQQRLRVQALLADRFQLKIHPTTKELPVYALAVAKNGPKLQEAKDTDDGPPSARPGGSFTIRGGELGGQGVNMALLAQALSEQLSRTVLDKTGLTGRYDFKLTWTPEGRAPTDAAPSADGQGPSIFTALKEQLGLKLEAQKGPVEILVIDRVEKPTAN